MVFRSRASLAIIIAVALMRGITALLLLYPQSSVLQLTSSLSVPLAALLPTRSLFFDWGFQMNYDFPSKLSSFYNAPIWPWRRRRMASVAARRHPNDFTAGEFYASVQQMLHRHGFDRSCLLRSVCEWARQPLEDVVDNPFSALLSYVLSPMRHRGFAGSEFTAQATYELAERRGLAKGDCRLWYTNCTMSPLDLISKIV